MRIIKVTDRKTKRKFLDTARVIYKNDPVWVCPLDNDIEAVFDPHRNPYFSHGEAERWIAEDDEGNLAGRIASFIDQSYSGAQDQPTGGMGFFECINDRETAFLLFDTAREWLAARGSEAMDGPVNFGETDKYWGLLVEGFTHPSYNVPYNHPYYRELFEAYGFQTFYTMEGYHFNLMVPMSDRFRKIAEWIYEKPGYEFRHFTWKEKDKFQRDFAEIYNEAWPSFKVDFKPVDKEYLSTALSKLKPIMDEEFLWFAYFRNKPIGMYVMMPDLNQILKHLNGKMNLFTIIRFLWLKRRKTMTRAKGLMIGVVPGFQNHGIESALIMKQRKVMDSKPHYTETEFSWIADFNPKMRKVLKTVGGIPAKHYITYRYLFDRTKEFRRYPIPDIKL